jgi:hypothetical protein
MKNKTKQTQGISIKINPNIKRQPESPMSSRRRSKIIAFISKATPNAENKIMSDVGLKGVSLNEAIKQKK